MVFFHYYDSIKLRVHVRICELPGPVVVLVTEALPIPGTTSSSTYH